VSYNTADYMARTSARTAAARHPRERAIAVPHFGARLRELRGDRTIADVCRAVRAYGFALDHSTLIHYERGTVKAPDPALLFVLAQHYGVEDLGDLIHVLVRERLGRPARQHVVFVSHSWDYSREQRRVAEQFAEISARSQSVIIFTLKKFHELDQPPRLDPVRRRGRP